MPGKSLKLTLPLYVLHRFRIARSLQNVSKTNGMYLQSLILYQMVMKQIIDALRRSACDHEERKGFGLHTVLTDYRELNRVYDIIFITNPTEYHLDTLQKV